MAKEGCNFYYKHEYPKADPNEVLNAFSIIISAIIENFDKKNMEIEEFYKELEIFEEEIGSAKNEGVINSNNLKNSLRLFQIISGKLLMQSHKITEREEDLFGS